MTARKRSTPARERGTNVGGNAVASGRRLTPEARERQIVEKAIDHFATHGFSGSSRGRSVLPSHCCTDTFRARTR
nr:hypothetical protein [Burkholderia sp. Bp9031]